MAKNRPTSSRDHPLRFVEEHLKRKHMRAKPQRTQPLWEGLYGTKPRAEEWNPAPNTTTISIPFVTVDGIFQAGGFYQGGSSTNMGGIRAGIGVDGGDCYRVNGDNNGVRLYHTARFMLHDLGQLSVWVKGFNGGDSSEGDEYVISIHQFNDEATPADEENFVIRWEYDAGATPVHYLRFYPDLGNYPTTYVQIELDEADWQDEDWHLITAQWNYQEQTWVLKWDDTEGTLVQPATPDLVPWPGWWELTNAELFTDLNGEYDIFHDVQFFTFGSLGTGTEAGGSYTPEPITHCVLYQDILALSTNGIFPSRQWKDETLTPAGIPTILSALDVPRQITVGCTPGMFETMTGTVTINGQDADGAVIGDVITVNTGVPATYTSTHAYAVITSVVTDKTDAGSTSNYYMGRNDVLGLPNYPFNATTDVFKIKVNTASITIPSVNITYGTVNCSAIVGGNDYTFWYRPNKE